MSELQKRLASSVVLLGLGLLGYFIFNWLSIYAQDFFVYVVLLLVFARLGYEWSFLVPAENSLKKHHYLRFLLPVVVLGILILYVGYYDLGFFDYLDYGFLMPYILIILTIVVFAHVISSFVRHFHSGYTDHPCFVALAGIAYITLGGVGFLWIWQLSDLHYPLFFMALIVIADSAAYFGGKKWGKHKLCPSISPGKTWEGFLSGFIAVIVFCLLCIFLDPFSDTNMVIDNLVLFSCLVLAAAVGDLYISLLKRRSGLKDVASLIPGHGGLLDRLDSHLMVFAIFWSVFFWINY